MNKLTKMMCGVMCMVGMSAYGGVMEVLTVNPDTGAIVSVKDYDSTIIKSPALIDAKHQPAGDVDTNKTDIKTTEGEITQSVSDASKLTNNKVVTSEHSTATPVTSSIYVGKNGKSTYQPTTLIEPAQNILDSSRYEFLKVQRPNKRVFIERTDGLIYFHQREGSLKENILALLNATGTKKVVMSEISDNHRVDVTVWLSGESVLEILDSMLLPYTSPYTIYARPYINHVVKVEYNEKY
ncbi:TPA: hypothetical protein I7682_17690 [Vibrio vulnificus]|nr:hypothetical protein [Vibrio vulnificus]